MRCIRICLCGMLFAMVAGTAFGQGSQTTSQVRFSGTTSMIQGGLSNSAAGGEFIKEGPEVDSKFTKPQITGDMSPARISAAHVPSPAGSSFASGAFFGFPGMTHKDQHDAPTGVEHGGNFQLEPPDQGLAVGSGYVVEAVNNAVAVYDTSGHLLATEATSALFGIGANYITDASGNEIVSYGPDPTDPRVYYDADTGRFFVTELVFATDPETGDDSGTTALYIAVSQSSDPTGSWNVFNLDVTNDGDAAYGSCPCFGDQPLIGADNYGFYINTNAFSLETFTFRGAQLYAISKQALVSGTPPGVSAVRFHNLIQAEGPAYSMQPATVPPGGAFETANGGTEYFVSALDFYGTVDNRVTVWALTNTSTLGDATPDLHLTNKVINTQTYGQPPNAQQQDGPTPLLYALWNAYRTYRNHLELVASNDDRMQQVVFADGKLWTALDTSVQMRGTGPVRAGIAYFILSPSLSGSATEPVVNATVAKQGYVAINSPSQNSVLYPSIGVNSNGQGVMCFSVVGQDYYPSAAYVPIDATNGAGSIVIAGPGTKPDDGFSGYAPYGYRVGRWGDYSAAVADETGSIWIANEYVSDAARTTYANWATFITQVNP